MLLAVVATISTLHLEGDVTAGSGDYVEVPFAVPAGTVEFEVDHSVGDTFSILDFGIWQPDAAVPGGDFRGWSGGLTDALTIGVAQSSRGYLPGPIAADTWTLVIGKAKLGSSPAHYTLDITFRDAATLTVQPQAAYTPIVMSSERRWYKGDFHVHDTESGDASGTLLGDATLAKLDGLDFANFSDHNTISQHALIAAQQAGWPILALRGSEITTYSGHGNAVGNTAYVDHRLGLRGRTITDVVNDVTAQDALFIVNHPATNLGDNCIGCFWEHEADTPWDKVSGIEVLTSGWDVGVLAFTPTVLAMWDRVEALGNRIAAVAGSDDHRAGSGEGSTGAPVGEPCTNVLADELSEAGIMAAVKARHTFVQLRNCSDVSIEAFMTTKDGGSADIGDEVDGIDNVQLKIHVIGGDSDFAQVWRDGENVGQMAVGGNDFTWTYTETPGTDPHRYRIEIVNSGNQRLLISSHFYVQGVAATGSGMGMGGSGCAAGGDSSGGGLLLLALLALRKRANS
jgi:hypothetical protein